MLVKHLIPALAAIGSAAAQSKTCTVSTTTIHSQAEATKLADCKTVAGTVVIADDASGAIDLSGPKEITGGLRVNNNSAIEVLQSNTIEKIGGEFTLNAVTILHSVQFPALTEVETLSWTSVGKLGSMSLGPLTKADEVTLSDTFLNTLDGIDLKTVQKLNINNNRRLTKFTTQLRNLGDNLIIQANGLQLEVTLPNLAWIANMAIANVTKFSAPSLKVVNGSARFDSNYFTTFSAPNLTHTETGDISFVGNANLDNLTFPVLTSIGGGLLIANNTALEKMNAFPKLEEVGGAIKLRGSFDEIEFPSLDVVEGAFDAASTEDIEKSCEELQVLAPRNKGGDGHVLGTYACTSDDADANEDTGTGTSAGGTGTGDDDDESSAAGVALNTALFGLVAIAAVASAL